MSEPTNADRGGGVIAMVAFRGGSKRLPKKNGFKIAGKTLYEISLDKLLVMKRSGLLDAVVASTDNLEWRQHCGELYGDEVILHDRPESVSLDSSNTTDVVDDFLEQHPEFKSHAVMNLLCVYPFLKPSVIENMIKTHKETGKSVYPLVKTHHMPQKYLRIGEGDVLRPYMFENIMDYQENTKLLLEEHPQAYITTGCFLNAANRDMWHQDDIKYVMDDSFHVDIDTMEDFELAELRYAQKKDFI